MYLHNNEKYSTPYEAYTPTHLTFDRFIKKGITGEEFLLMFNFCYLLFLYIA